MMLPYPVGHARSATIEAAVAAAEAKHASTVKRLYVATPLKYIDHLSTLPFSSSVNQSEAAQQLVRTTNSSLSSILRLCDERNSESLRSAMWILRVGVPPPAIFREGHHALQADVLCPHYLDGRIVWAGGTCAARWSPGT